MPGANTGRHVEVRCDHGHNGCKRIALVGDQRTIGSVICFDADGRWISPADFEPSQLPIGGAPQASSAEEAVALVQAVLDQLSGVGDELANELERLNRAVEEFFAVSGMVPLFAAS